MKLFNRKNADANAIPDDLKPYYAANGGGVRRWLGPVLRGLLLLVLVGLLVWGGIWSVSKIMNRNASNKSTSSSQTAATNDDTSDQSSDTSTSSPTPAPAATPAPSTTKTTPATPTTPAPAPAATPAPTSAPATTGGSGAGTTATSDTPETLTNTGPGEVVALFVAATIFGGFVYRSALLRKQR